MPDDPTRKPPVTRHACAQELTYLAAEARHARAKGNTLRVAALHERMNALITLRQKLVA